jgi:hypothetical protein
LAGGDGRGKISKENVRLLQDACDVVDALGRDVRRSLVRAFNRKQLRPYTQLFRRSASAGGPQPEMGDTLDSIEKRYMWFRRSILDIEVCRCITPVHRKYDRSF